MAQEKGKYSEYLRMTNHNNIVINGFSSLSITEIKNLCHGNPPPPLTTILAPTAGEEMNGTKEIRVKYE